MVGVQRDAHKAFLRPEAECVADEAEDIGGGRDGERFHDLSPSGAALAVGVGFSSSF